MYKKTAKFPPVKMKCRGTFALFKRSFLVMFFRFLSKTLEEVGLASLWRSPLDTKLLCLQRFVRLFGYGSSTLILVSYLSALEISKSRIGLFMTLTLIGDTLLSFILTIFADALGRRAILLLGAVLMTVSGVVFALVGNYWILLVAAIVGVISPRFVRYTWLETKC